MSEEKRDIFGEDVVREFTQDEEEQKRFMYEKMSLRRRKFVDRIGFDKWDPFQLPKDPMDIRRDMTERTAQELMRDFLQTVPRHTLGNDYARGILECAMGMVNKDDKYRGIYDFCLWYEKQLDNK